MIVTIFTLISLATFYYAIFAVIYTATSWTIHRFFAAKIIKLYEINNTEKLLPYFTQAHEDYLSEYHLNGQRRSGYREYVMYKNSPFPCPEERLAFILSYLKLNPLQEHHADLFDIEQKQCYEFVHGLRIILHHVLEYAGCMPAQTDKELQVRLSEFSKEEEKILLHDGTEREVPRPQDEDGQKEKYSGKKKKHTVKNAVIISASCMILFVSQTFSGRIHDKTIADNAYHIPAGFTLFQDSGYQGYSPLGVKIIQPQKKPKGKDLAEEQKVRNREISINRVRVEHAIGSVKRVRIVKDEGRLRKDNFVNNIFSSCAALHNKLI
jgi:hypothetical protein